METPRVKTRGSSIHGKMLGIFPASPAMAGLGAELVPTFLIGTNFAIKRMRLLHPAFLQKARGGVVSGADFL